MRTLPHCDRPVLRLSLSDLILLLKACGGGSYVLMEPGPGGEPSFGMTLRIVGPVWPGKAATTHSACGVRVTPQAQRTPIEYLLAAAEALTQARRPPIAYLLAAAEALEEAARASTGDGADALSDMSLRRLLIHALLARYSRDAANE